MQGASAKMSRLIFWVMLGTVLLLPVPFGSIYPSAYTVFAVVVALLIGAWCLVYAMSDTRLPSLIDRVWLPSILFAAVIAWALVQISPWIPESLHNPEWADTARILGQEVQGYISVDPQATGTAIMRLLSYAGIFWLALQFGRSSENARLIFVSIVVSGVIYAGYGIGVELSGTEKILWFDKERYQDSLTSTFRYKNGFATYAGMVLICATALLVQAFSETHYAGLGIREKIRVSINLLFERTWYSLAGIVIVFSALLLSNSRAGVFATLIAGCVFFASLKLASNISITFRRSYFLAILAAVGVFLLIGGGTVMDRLANNEGDFRQLIFDRTVDAIAEKPLLGWGLGTFEPVFAQFHPPGIDVRIVRAHNEYLDNALGLGIPATVLLLSAIGWLAITCLLGVRRRRRNQTYPAAGFAIVALVGLHSLADFTMQIPAVSATFALLLGTCVAQSFNTANHRD